MRGVRWAATWAAVFMMAEVSGAAEVASDPLVEQLLERIRALEERLDKLERVEVVKTATEFVCPGGEIFDQPPPGGRCPDGGRPQLRETVRKATFSRRESIAEKIEAAMQEAAVKKVAIGGAARGGVQQVLNAPKGQNNLYGQGSLDVTLLFRPMARTTMFVDLEAVGGPGPDRVLGTLSRVNADAETLGGQDQRLTVREAWLGFRLLDDRLDAILGKLDPTNYFDRNAFANDETTQFLNASLVNNPLLRQPLNGPGLVGRWDADRELGFSGGVHATGDLERDLGRDPFVIAEVDARSAAWIEGNYRLWGRVGGDPEEPRKHGWGVGLSLDQYLTPQVGVFARAGVGRLIDGDDLTSYSWSGGVHVAAPFGRRRDHFGLGYTFLHQAAGDEQVAESYYDLFLTDHLSLIANVEWLISGPNRVTGDQNRHVVIPGLRALVGF